MGTTTTGGSRRSRMGNQVFLVVNAGYQGKREIYARMAGLGARLVVVDEPGHWSQALVEDGLAERWLAAPISGDPDTDAQAVLDAVRRSGVEPTAVITVWEDSVGVAARVAAELGLPGNPAAAVDSVRSKVRMRATSVEHGLPTPAARRVTSFDDLIEAADEIGFPAVLKPEYGALAMGCVRIDDLDYLSEAYWLAHEAATPEHDPMFRAGRGLLLEDYLDGVEFDIDLVMFDGECVFHSVSQNWPTHEPSFQETGLHCPPDHDPAEVAELVQLAITTAQRFGLHLGVLHIEGKCTSRGPRLLEVNARMGGARIFQIVEAVWGVDLVACILTCALGERPDLSPHPEPRRGVVNHIVHADHGGHLVDLSFCTDGLDDVVLHIDIEVEPGEKVDGPEHVFATALAELTLIGDDVAHARARMAHVLCNPPVIDPHPALATP